MRKKPKASPVFVQKFEVVGSGLFPFDMLRMDSCCPDRTEDAAKMANQGVTGIRTIRLRMYGVDAKGPTVERWRSFGWSVDPNSMKAPGYGGTIPRHLDSPFDLENDAGEDQLDGDWIHDPDMGSRG